jgi:hypothetical protein
MTRTNQQRGLDLAQAALDNDTRTTDQDRELRYLLAGVATGPGSLLLLTAMPRLCHASQLRVFSSNLTHISFAVVAVVMLGAVVRSMIFAANRHWRLKCMPCRVQLPCSNWGAAWMLAGRLQHYLQ